MRFKLNSSAGRQAQHVVALDPDVWAAQGARQVGFRKPVRVGVDQIGAPRRGRGVPGEGDGGGDGRGECKMQNAESEPQNLKTSAPQHLRTFEPQKK